MEGIHNILKEGIKPEQGSDVPKVSAVDPAECNEEEGACCTNCRENMNCNIILTTHDRVSLESLFALFDFWEKLQCFFIVF